jgi:hypothetical protein
MAELIVEVEVVTTLAAASFDSDLCLVDQLAPAWQVQFEAGGDAVGGAAARILSRENRS